MKKRISVLLCLVMVLSLCLCGCGKNDTAILGTWKTNIDMAEAVNEAMSAEDPELGKYLALPSFNVTMTMTFREDGTYKMEVDEAAVLEELDNVSTTLMYGMLDYLQVMLAEQGLELDYNAIIEMSGLNLETVKEELKNSIDLEAMFREVDMEGQYLAEKGKLYTTPSLSEKVSKSSYESYMISGNTMVVNEGKGAPSVGDFIYPVRFEKIG